MSEGHSAQEKTCGLNELLVFAGALVAGTACSLTSKELLNMKSIGMSGVEEAFSFPLFQTFGMFLGMMGGLLMHFIVIWLKIPFPGYKHKGQYRLIDRIEEEEEPFPIWMYFVLIFPSMFDLVATALCMYGLMEVSVSVYQMLRGSAIVFVALLKHFVLQGRLKKFMWVGILWNVASIVLVGGSAMFSSSGDDDSTANVGGGEGGRGKNPGLGVLLILLGAFVQSLQYAFEEKVMTMSIATPPLLLIGMEGLWGTILCVALLYPIAYNTHGSDHGSIENPFNTWVMIQNSVSIQIMFVAYFVSVFLYNILACLVTFMLNSVWHAILDNFRPITVWGVDLFIYYLISRPFGESWTKWSFIQLIGMFVLLYGTAIYNAPNPGSVELRGGLLNLCLDFSEEYDQMKKEADDMKRKLEADGVKTDDAPQYYNTMSPFLFTPSGTAEQRQKMRELDNQLMFSPSQPKKPFSSANPRDLPPRGSFKPRAGSVDDMEGRSDAVAMANSKTKIASDYSKPNYGTHH